MRRRPFIAVLLAATTVTTIGLTACDSPRVAALNPDCTTKGLKWQATVLKKKPRTLQRDAKLTVVNKGDSACVFRGYPVMEVRVGKGPETRAVARQGDLSLNLNPGNRLTFPLRYQDTEKGPDSPACLVSSEEAIVKAPRDTKSKTVTVRDESGKRSRMDVCDGKISISPAKRTSE